ncbi:MAG TPA: branched-chain amino acid ABC transporter permease [Chloroflexota bacterium]|nr:branched-chain amino acid ABC transporter permease [Chloroflexota bacterium]
MKLLRRFGPLGLLIVLALAPFPVGDAAAIIRVLDLIAIYCLLALGLNVVTGFAGLLVLGYAAFYAVGAYTYAFLASAQFNIHWPFLLLLVLGGILAAFFGLLLGIPVLRLRGDYLAIVTLGFGEIIRLFLNNLSTLTNGPQGISLIDTPDLFGYQLSTPTHVYYLLLVLLAVSVVFLRRLEGSRIGRAWAAIREDEGAARAMGVDTTRLKLMAFAIGASTAGLAGVMFAALQGFVSPESFTFWESILMLSMVVVGGIGSIPGVIIGAIALIGIPELLREYSDYRMLAFGLVMILMMILRPGGIWPSAMVSAEMRAGHGDDTAEETSSAELATPTVGGGN